MYDIGKLDLLPKLFLVYWKGQWRKKSWGHVRGPAPWVETSEVVYFVNKLTVLSVHVNRKLSKLLNS